MSTAMSDFEGPIRRCGKNESTQKIERKAVILWRTEEGKGKKAKASKELKRKIAQQGDSASSLRQGRVCSNLEARTGCEGKA